MRATHIDLIGDVHGRCRELCALLKLLGYRESDGAFAHARRQAVFCGDLIDRGQENPSTLRLVKAMVDRGSAQIVLGNHELAAICFTHHTPDGKPLRRHEGMAYARFCETRAQFSAAPAEFDAYIEWFRSWPLSLEVAGVRVVHAAWHDAAIACIGTRSLREDAFLRAACASGTSERAAIRVLLRGFQLRLPSDRVWRDAAGRVREKIRCKWWLDAAGRRSYREWALPSCEELPDEDAGPLGEPGQVPAYPAVGVPPVFFGHYRLAGSPMPFGNVACLDYSASATSALTAYRWDGEAELSAEKFVMVPAQPPLALA